MGIVSGLMRGGRDPADAIRRRAMIEGLLEKVTNWRTRPTTVSRRSNQRDGNRAFSERGVRRAAVAAK
jgi:hypothetical protein